MQRSKRVTITTMLGMCFLLTGLAGGCAHGRTKVQPHWTAPEYAERLYDVVGRSRELVHGQELRKLRELISADIFGDRQNSVAMFILQDGPWRKCLWYSDAEAHFANVWRMRQVPITMGASQKTIGALCHVARSSSWRHARVAAALAIITVKPEVAKPALMADYAKFEIVDLPPGYTHTRLAAGDALFRLGVPAVPEVTNPEEFHRLLQKRPDWRGSPDDRNRTRLVKAANLYNRQLRMLFERQAISEIESLYGLSERLDLALRCYRKIEKATPEGPVIHVPD